jgi:hypothetical protein
MEKIMYGFVCFELIALIAIALIAIALIAIAFYKPATPKELGDWIDRI